MPNRILREGILTSERVDALTWASECFYRRLHSVVDDYGRYYANPSLLRAACYPLKLDKVSNADIGKWLGECSGAALVSTYENEGKRYLQLWDFRQQVRATASRFPQPPDKCAADAQQLHTKTYPYSETKTEPKSKGAAPRAVNGSTFKPPDWVPAESWTAWVEVRSKLKAPNTDRALALAVRDLTTLRNDGYSPQAVLELATTRGWRGLFPPKSEAGAPIHGRPTKLAI